MMDQGAVMVMFLMCVAMGAFVLSEFLDNRRRRRRIREERMQRPMHREQFLFRNERNIDDVVMDAQKAMFDAVREFGGGR